MRDKVLTLLSSRIFMIWSLGLLAIFFASLYVFFLNQSVFNLAERKANEEKIAVLEGEVANLESVYMSKTSKIDMKLASSLGFVDSSKEMNYAVLKPSTVSLLSDNNEI